LFEVVGLVGDMGKQNEGRKEEEEGRRRKIEE
jgi:hypothetical protein